ncbi:MAG TPA: luciferase family protein [Acidimicrobiia bacterium]|nr:luciferase family protein [Acidimicrobiia bacterium]
MMVAGACSAGDPAAVTGTGGALELPEREGPRRQTTGDVPHIQLDAEPVPAVDAELRRRAFQLPGVENLPSDRSLPGARGLALSDSLDLSRADVIAGSREFAHIHPDGSLHVWLSGDSAIEVHDKKWGELHPWVDRDGFWSGVVMLYTPENLDELDVTIRILVDAYNFVTGASLTPAEIP